MNTEKLNKKAIFLGFALDLFGSLAAWTAFHFIVGVVMGIGGYDFSIETSRFIWFSEEFIGGVMSIIGGFYAARVARYRLVEHGLWVGIVSFFVGIPMLLLLFLTGVEVQGEPIRLGREVLVTLLWIGLPTLGGYLAHQLTPDNVGNIK